MNAMTGYSKGDFGTFSGGNHSSSGGSAEVSGRMTSKRRSEE